jgi:hypothetical protein
MTTLRDLVAQWRDDNQFNDPIYRLCADELEAALSASDTQPLTDEMIEDWAAQWSCTSLNRERLAAIEGAKWARDRMAQQAQPPVSGTQSYNGWCGVPGCKWPVGVHHTALEHVQ